MGEGFGPKPRFNRRTGVGWGFVMGRDGYSKKTKTGGDGMGEDAWSSHGTSGESRKVWTPEMPVIWSEGWNETDGRLQSVVNDPNTAQRESYYEDCNPQQYQRGPQQVRRARPSQQYRSYDELDRSDDEGPDDVVHEPFPDLPQIPGIEQRFDQQQLSERSGWGGQFRIIRNDEMGQVRSVNETRKGPKFVVNDGRGEEYEHGDKYGTGKAIEMRDLTEVGHA